MFRCSYWQIVSEVSLGRSAFIFRAKQFKTLKIQEIRAVETSASIFEVHMKYPSRLGPSVLFQLQRPDCAVKKWH